MDDFSIGEEPTSPDLIEVADLEQTGRERFIPLTRFALLDRLARASEQSVVQSPAWPGFVRRLAAWRHMEHRDRLMRLKERYLPFSPDRDTVRVLTFSDSELDRIRTEFVTEVTALLERANYERITEEDLQELLNARSPYGLKLDVDLSEYEEILIFSRGSAIETREERDIKKLYLSKKKFEVPVFLRLFMLAKLKTEKARLAEIMQTEGLDADKAEKRLRQLRKHLPKEASFEHIYLKLFKRIPQIDLEMLFPNTKVSFKPLDKIRLGLTAGGGTAAGVFGAATKVMAAANPVTLAIALAGLVGVIFRQVMAFFNTRNQYMMVLAQNLFFHNLANNRGVLTLLVDRAEEEDIKEDLLLYAFFGDGARRLNALGPVKRAIEDFVERETGKRLDYDLFDTIERLRADGLLIEGGNGSIVLMSPEDACRHLEHRWQSCLDRDASEPVMQEAAAS